MAGFDHKPAQETEADDTATSGSSARYGLTLFAVYSAFYAVFVAINAFWPEVMSTAVAGVNLAVSYGLGLIVAAIVLSLAYSWLCSGSATRTKEKSIP